MYVFTCVYRCTYIYVCLYTRRYTCLQLCTGVYACMCVHIHDYICFHSCTDFHACGYVCTYTDLSMSSLVWCTVVCTHVCKWRPAVFFRCLPQSLSSLLFLSFISCVYMYVPDCLYNICTMCVQWLEKPQGHPPGSCLVLVLKTKLRSSARPARALNHWASSPALPP